MRITTLVACALAGSVFFSGCSKSDTDPLPVNYRVDGVQDVSLQYNGSIPITGYLSFSVVPTGKIQEHVSLSMEGLPDGCGATFSSTGGFPTFTSSVILKDSNANGGTYPVKLVCDGSVSGKKSYKFNLTLPQLPDCSSWMLRGYTASNTCSGGSSYSEYITAGTVRNKIVFNNFEDAGVSLYANVYCQSTGSTNISMPSQTVNGVTYSGSGYATPSYFYVYYTRYSPGSGSTSCTVYLY